MRTVSQVVLELAMDVANAKDEDDQTVRIYRQIEKRDREWEIQVEYLKAQLNALRTPKAVGPT
jgi:hypothetical protein